MVKPLLDFLHFGLKVRLQKGNLQLVCHSPLVQRGLWIPLWKDIGVQRGAKAWYKCWDGISTTTFVVRFPSYKSVWQELVSSVLSVLKLCTDSSGQEMEKKPFPNISFSFSTYFFVCHKEYNASTSPLEGGIAAFLRSPLFYYIFTSVCGGLTLLKLSCQKPWETPSFFSRAHYRMRDKSW